MDESSVEPAAHADHIVDAAVPLITALVDHTYPVYPPMIEPDVEDYLDNDNEGDNSSVCMEVEESDDDTDDEMIDDCGYQTQ